MLLFPAPFLQGNRRACGGECEGWEACGAFGRDHIKLCLVHFIYSGIQRTIEMKLNASEKELSGVTWRGLPSCPAHRALGAQRGATVSRDRQLRNHLRVWLALQRAAALTPFLDTLEAQFQLRNNE
jgi:hypothetical protein